MIRYEARNDVYAVNASELQERDYILNVGYVNGVRRDGTAIIFETYSGLDRQSLVTGKIDQPLVTHVVNQTTELLIERIG